jgi:hypothetical protein
MYSARKGDSSIVMDLNVPIAGDVLVRVYHYQDLLIGKSYPRLIFRYAPFTVVAGAGVGVFTTWWW